MNKDDQMAKSKYYAEYNDLLQYCKDHDLSEDIVVDQICSMIPTLKYDTALSKE